MNKLDKQQLNNAIIQDLNDSTLEKRVKIPIIENFIMGLSLFVLVLSVSFFLMNFNDVPIRRNSEFTNMANYLISIAGLLGILLFTSLNLVRFGKDEWNLLTLAYKLGYKARDNEVNQLKAIINNKDFEPITDQTKLEQFKQCLTLLSQHYRINNISRNNRPSGMTEKEYTTCRKILIKTNIIDNQNNKQYTNFNQAALQLKQYFQLQ